MKKIIFLLALMVPTVTVFAQQPFNDNQTANTIKQNAELNNGLKSPDQVPTGYTLWYNLKYPDGFSTFVSEVTQAGDYQYRVVKRLSTNHYQAAHGGNPNAITQTTPPAQPALTPPTFKLENPAQQTFMEKIGNHQVLSLLTLVLIILLVFLIKYRHQFDAWVTRMKTKISDRKSNKEKTMAELPRFTNPVADGTPYYPGGMNTENQHHIVVENVSRVFPGATSMEILSWRRGLISCPEAIVGFAGEIEKAGALVREPGLEARVRYRIDNEPVERLMYTLAGCGNPIKYGRGFTGDNITFEELADQIEVPIPVSTEQSNSVPVVATQLTADAAQVSIEKPGLEVLLTNLPEVLSMFVGNTVKIDYTNPNGGMFNLLITPPTAASQLPATEEHVSDRQTARV